MDDIDDDDKEEEEDDQDMRDPTPEPDELDEEIVESDLELDHDGVVQPDHDDAPQKGDRVIDAEATMVLVVPDACRGALICKGGSSSRTSKLCCFATE
ncbi:hsc70-interacting protein-like [Triticum dicoccoides]|uniref:hsc70-interacting protein-like n=1 Tax=Triticum dicoccoides TaxID=85692 RepID=UPI00188E39D6|nr:hsc70-interacting protein-like [Triticum dicoccoides]